jgi:hypothetical protein
MELISLDTSFHGDADLIANIRNSTAYVTTVGKEYDRLTGVAMKALQLPNGTQNIDLRNISDTLFVRSRYNFPIQLTPTELEAIFQQDHLSHVYLLRNSSEFAQKSVNTLFNIISGNMKRSTQNDTNAPRFVLLSGHDTSILAILEGLFHIRVDKNPDYASTLEFLLWGRDDGDDGLVTVLWNGRRLTDSICGSATQNGVCKVQDFFNLVST